MMSLRGGDTRVNLESVTQEPPEAIFPIVTFFYVRLLNL
jgi:hypothetical protein